MSECNENKRYAHEAAADTERAWMEFQQNYNTPESVGKSLYAAEINHSTPEVIPKHNHLRVRTMIAVAAVIILIVIFMIPPVLGYENFPR